MSVATELVRSWNQEGVRLNQGADVAELAALRERLGSDDDGQLWELYSLANGMVDNEYDARHVSFWSMAKIAKVAIEDPSPPLAFADFLIDSWYFRLERSASGLVVLSDNVRPGDRGSTEKPGHLAAQRLRSTCSARTPRSAQPSPPKP